MCVEDVGSFFSGVFQLQFLKCRILGIGFALQQLLCVYTLHRFEHAQCPQEVEEQVLLHQLCSIVPVSEKSGTLFFLMGADHFSLEALFGVFCSLAVLLKNSYSPEVRFCSST